MELLVVRKLKSPGMGIRVRLLAIWIVCFVLVANLAWSKEAPLTAIELYDGPSGAAYVQIMGVLISAKTEMRATATPETPMDHGFYNKLAKVTLAVGGMLERGVDGVLRYTAPDGTTAVVVPQNAKFEHGASLSPAQLADQAVLRGAAIEPGAQVPALGRGVTLVFVAAPDVELAEYLRAKRANAIPAWQNYLAKYPTAPHSQDAKKRLAGLFTASGTKSFESYEKTAASATPAYDDLKSAHDAEEQARALAPQLPEVATLDESVHKALSGILDNGRSELDSYRAALKAKTPGYAHLGTAKNLEEAANGIAMTKSGDLLQADVMKDYNAVQSAMRQAESSTTAKQFDQALMSVTPYRSFEDEEPRIAAVVQANYAYHMDRGKQAAASGNWDAAITEFEKAANARNTPDAKNQLAHAREQWTIVQDKDAAQKAQAASANYEQEKDIIKAYEVLDGLPPSQRKLVEDDLNRLQPAYVQRCSQLAKERRQAHEPLRGLSDEEGILSAYNYVARAYKLSGDESFHDRMDLMGEELSAYLLDQAKRLLAKPAGSGTELAWTYLTEAEGYKASNLSAVRDAKVAAAAAHAIRSKLSIRVQFRDSTSQSDSAGFAGQLENAVIAGLDTSKIPVKVVRAGESTPVDPDYLLEGDVLQRSANAAPVLESIESQYVANTREVISEDWNKANRAYEKAQMDLQTAQDLLQGAEAKGDKRKVQDLARSAHEAEKVVEDAHVVLDSTPKTVTENVLRPYSYTRKTVTLKGAIHMQFRIVDAFSSERAEMVPITREDGKKYTVLENVKAEDTAPPKQTDTAVDQVEFLTGLSNSAVDELVGAVRQRVEALPKKLYQQAKDRETGEDLDGAGEAYMRFLEIWPDDGSPEVIHAKEFLQDQFNMKPNPVVSAAQ